MTDYSFTTRRVWDSEEEPTMVDEILEGKGKKKVLSEVERTGMHDFVLDNVAHIDHYRELYEAQVQERALAQREFRRRHPLRSGRRRAAFPPDLEDLLRFAQWFEEAVQNEIEEGVMVSSDIQESSKLPCTEAKCYKSMYSYGYHYRVRSVVQSSKATNDCGVAAVFRQPCRASRQDENIISADLEYVGEIVGIVELDYGGHSIVLLVCDWVKANYRGRNATVKKDEWGFTVANFRARVPFGYESFAFPIHCQQVFFSDDEEDSFWKVVLRTEVRGRGHYAEGVEDREPELFSMGRDSDYEGLRMAEEEEVTYWNPQRSGRQIPINEVLNDAEVNEYRTSDGDMGASSKEEM